jgi:ATP-binding cassette subfamily B protein IrtA
MPGPAPRPARSSICAPRLRDDFGFPKQEIHAQAYWTEGKAMGSKRGDDKAATPAPKPKPTVTATKPAEQAPAKPAAAPTGTWRAQAAGRLLAPLKRKLIISGVLQALITLIELAPFVLLVELARLLLTGADADRLWDLVLPRSACWAPARC